MEKIFRKSMIVLGAVVLASLSVAKGAQDKNDPVSVVTTVDRPMIHVGEGEQKVVIKIEVIGQEAELKDRMPLNLAIVLDRSGSMSGAKLEQAKQAAEMLVDQLTANDVLSLVLYDSDVEVALPATKVGKRHQEIKRMIRRIQTGGSTALYGGVEQGGKELAEYLSKRRINRVMLLSDGIANVGPSSNREIAGLGSQLAKRGMPVTTIGLGADYNETLMSALSESSDANYYHVADVETLPDVFEKELGELKSIIARDFEIKIECPEGVRPIRFLGRPGELESQLSQHSFATVAGGQTRELYLECAVSPAVQGDLNEIASVSGNYASLDGGGQFTVPTRAVVVGYTEDVALADKSINRAVEAEAVIYANSVETERTLAYSDAGQNDLAEDNIAHQRAGLKGVLATAPEAQRRVIQQELERLNQAESEIQSGGLTKAKRKEMWGSTYDLRNAK